MRAKQNTTVQAPAADYPYAEEADIRDLHAKAAEYRDIAATREQEAAKLLRDAEERNGQRVSDAQTKAASDVQQAQEMAAELIRQAHAQADEHVRHAQEKADEDVRQAQEQAAAELQAAKGQAGLIRADRDAALKKYRTWAGMAVEQAQRSGLASVEETLTDGLDVSGQVDGTETTP
jgi:vacuolar-type H+-ATPase subunit H